MIELALVFFILAGFVFPVPMSAGCLGLYTTWFLFRSYESFKNQPLKGKKILSATQFVFFLNFLASIALSALLASLVYIFIFDFFYLFLFNFIFCFLISIRWFDFSFKLLQKVALANLEINTDKKGFFVVCKGFKSESNLSVSPVFTDAGFMTLGENQVTFKGTFINKIFNFKNISNIEKTSLENLKISTNPSSNNEPHFFLISLKEQFYPFRSRENRDKIYKFISSSLKNPSAHYVN